MALDTRFPAGMTTILYKDMPLGSRRGIFIAASKTEKQPSLYGKKACMNKTLCFIGKNFSFCFNKITFLLNNNTKRFAFFVALFFGSLASSELNILFFDLPKFDHLSIITGKIRINHFRSRTSDHYTLLIGPKKISFNCLFPFSDKPCIPKEKFPEIQGKNGKAWWHKTDGKIYQLEVEGQLLINYPEQAQTYISIKESYLYPFTILFIFSALWFAIVQLANEPNKPQLKRH
jgi:hypothetical protein